MILPSISQIYLDHNATTPLAAEAREAIVRCLDTLAGNPSSLHLPGQKARAVVEEARSQIASEVGAEPEEVIFVSGGTEADNLALRGVMAARAARNKQRHLLVSAVEHPAVLATAQSLAEDRYEVEIIPVDGEGRVDPREVARRLRPDTALVSIMAANHELGTLQPIEPIARLLKSAGITFHVDAVQALAHQPVSLDVSGADLVSLSAHKAGGPQGIGALVIRESVPFVSSMTGGAQQGRRRAGTEAPALCAGFAAAVKCLQSGRHPEKLRMLRDRLEEGLLRRVPGSSIVGAAAPRLPNTSCVHFQDLEAQTLAVALDLEGLAVSHGAACASGMARPSHVLRALGLSEQQARGAVRFSLGATTTAEEIDRALEIVERVAGRVRSSVSSRTEIRS